MAEPTPQSSYVTGYRPSQVIQHEWRTAENSAAYMLPALESMRQQKPQLSMVDVGAGSGTISLSLARRIPDGHVTAVDLSDEILARARQAAQAAGVANMSFQQADVYALPFADGAFDVTHAHQVLCHLAEPVRAIKELLRVTRPGGLVALRETDMRTWCLWPDTPAVRRSHELWVKTHALSGASVNAGRQILGWALEAGARPETITMSFGTWSHSMLPNGDGDVLGEARPMPHALLPSITRGGALGPQ